MGTVDNELRKQLHKLEAGELWLIRSGQHLFKEWRAKGRSDKVLEESFEKIWELKREVRAMKRSLNERRQREALAASGGHSNG